MLTESLLQLFLMTGKAKQRAPERQAILHVQGIQTPKKAIWPSSPVVLTYQLMRVMLNCEIVTAMMRVMMIKQENQYIAEIAFFSRVVSFCAS